MRLNRVGFTFVVMNAGCLVFAFDLWRWEGQPFGRTLFVACASLLFVNLVGWLWWRRMRL